MGVFPQESLKKTLRLPMFVLAKAFLCLTTNPALAFESEILYLGLEELRQSEALKEQLSDEEKTQWIAELRLKQAQALSHNKTFVSDAALLLLEMRWLNSSTSAQRFLNRHSQVPVPTALREVMSPEVRQQLGEVSTHSETNPAPLIKVHLHQLWWYPSQCEVAANGLRVKADTPLFFTAGEAFHVQKLCRRKTENHIAQGVVPHGRNEMHIAAKEPGERKLNRSEPNQGFSTDPEHTLSVHGGIGWGRVGESHRDFHWALRPYARWGVALNLGSVWGAQALLSEVRLDPPVSQQGSRVLDGLFLQLFALARKEVPFSNQFTLGIQGGAGLSSLSGPAISRSRCLLGSNAAPSSNDGVER